MVQERLQAMDVHEGKMFGVIVVELPESTEWRHEDRLYFMAAYSGQLEGSYVHPWFVPPVVDYLAPDSYFQKEQREIDALNHRMEAMRIEKEHTRQQALLQQLRAEQSSAVAEAKRLYAEGKTRREQLRAKLSDDPQQWVQQKEAIIRESQHQKADIHRAKQLHKDEIVSLEQQLAMRNALICRLFGERKQRSEALQQWLFEHFEMLNGRGETKNLIEIFNDANGSTFIPSGAGECCAPKLLQAAYRLGLRPLAMAEFWWGPSSPDHYHQPGAFYPACHSKCRPVLKHMLEGLKVEPDPAGHYDRVHGPVRVVWEDEHLAVIAKPEGWVSIPGKSDQASIFDEAHRLWPDIEGSVVVHRLDMDTSGLMVVAKRAAVHRALSRQFESREVKKRYVALVEGVIATSGIVELPIAPDLDNLPRRNVDREHGKEGITRYELLDVEEHDGRKVSRVAFYPLTGRTHQLRVHSASVEGLGAPIVGDRLYGNVADRLYLHAEAIAFKHPVTHEAMYFELPVPF